MSKDLEEQEEKTKNKETSLRKNITLEDNKKEKKNKSKSNICFHNCFLSDYLF